MEQEATVVVQNIPLTVALEWEEIKDVEGWKRMLEVSMEKLVVVAAHSLGYITTRAGVREELNELSQLLPRHKYYKLADGVRANITGQGVILIKYGEVIGQTMNLRLEPLFTLLDGFD